MPLPAGLEAMDTEETVCKVCGVSYLVYREIKALEKKIKGLEAEIKEKSQAIEAANTASHLPRFCFVVTATNHVSKKVTHCGDGICGRVCLRVRRVRSLGPAANPDRQSAPDRYCMAGPRT